MKGSGRKMYSSEQSLTCGRKDVGAGDTMKVRILHKAGFKAGGGLDR